MRKSILILLCITLVVGSILRFYGIEWGVPRPPFWRYHYQDEGFTLGLILRMEPDNLNPHYFINPTFHYYTLLLSMKIASAVGYIQPFTLPIKTNNIGQPLDGVSLPDYAKMFYVGRVISIFQSILLILFVFLIGKNLYSAAVGLLAATFTTVLPTLVFQSHIFVVDAPGLFWLVVAFWFLTAKVTKTRNALWYTITGILIGIALGTKYSNILIVIPFFYHVYTIYRDSETPFLNKLVNRNTILTCAVAVVVFLLTSPYIVLSFNEFLHGDSEGFGGIFGERGLIAYNTYGISLLSPFTLSTFRSLLLPLTLATALSMCYLIYQKRNSDKLLLAYIIPFYVLLILNASPHLRHFLPVLPFLMLATSRFLTDVLKHKKHRSIQFIGILVVLIVILHPLAFSLAFLRRMDVHDTRVECAAWLKENITDETAIGVATFFPFNYTPPFETFTRNFVVTDYDYQRLLRNKPHFFVITEYEYEECCHTRRSIFACRRFVRRLFREGDYRITKVFKKDFSLWGIDMQPHFPLSWNPVNPTIYVFVVKS
ncbi:hypothetical protein AMJ87_06245 [candidate division WOR_3 bacterium SM23_60]|uniref:Glycosyltransferase RgtA/B/C/D-like domain-containing protein n=1 Tax=candidate division WOR_3 bacterium SM23_60 TaxID=1703780 RepID=A0A0S8GFT7_UNCW3|nr:MAG: hypothetical protein AMJ87_06245 [candidate division WOR_3 bacterium SM23_60]